METLWGMYTNGFVREMYSPGGPGAILVVEAPTGDEALAGLASLPLVANGLVDFDVVELHPFAALEALFPA